MPDLNGMEHFHYLRFNYAQLQNLANAVPGIVGVCYCLPNLSGSVQILFPYDQNNVYIRHSYVTTGWDNWSKIISQSI